MIADLPHAFTDACRQSAEAALERPMKVPLVCARAGAFSELSLHACMQNAPGCRLYVCTACAGRQAGLGKPLNVRGGGISGCGVAFKTASGACCLHVVHGSLFRLCTAVPSFGDGFCIR